MANTKSAKKAIKKIQRNSRFNKIYLTSMKTSRKKFLKAYEEFKLTPSPELKEKVNNLLSLCYQRIDLAVKKKLIHQNKAARTKSQLALKLKN